MTNERVDKLVDQARAEGVATISGGRHSAYCCTGPVVLVAPESDGAEWRIVQKGGNTGHRRDYDVTVTSGTVDDIRAALVKHGPSFQVGPGRCRMW